jgi:hypothetical protein
MKMLILVATLIFGFCMVINMAIRDSYAMDSRYVPDDSIFIRSGVGVIGGIITVVALISTLVNLKSVIMVWTAPKLWLIQEIIKIARGL